MVDDIWFWFVSHTCLGSGGMIDKLLAMRKSLKDTLQILEDEILDNHLLTWRSKAENGFKAQAIMQYRKEYPRIISIEEAKAHVEDYIEYVNSFNHCGE